MCAEWSVWLGKRSLSRAVVFDSLEEGKTAPQRKRLRTFTYVEFPLVPGTTCYIFQMWNSDMMHIFQNFTIYWITKYKNGTRLLQRVALTFFLFHKLKRWSKVFFAFLISSIISIQRFFVADWSLTENIILWGRGSKRTCNNITLGILPVSGATTPWILNFTEVPIRYFIGIYQKICIGVQLR